MEKAYSLFPYFTPQKSSFVRAPEHIHTHKTLKSWRRCSRGKTNTPSVRLFTRNRSSLALARILTFPPSHVTREILLGDVSCADLRYVREVFREYRVENSGLFRFTSSQI